MVHVPIIGYLHSLIDTLWTWHKYTNWPEMHVLNNVNVPMMYGFVSLKCCAHTNLSIFREWINGLFDNGLCWFDILFDDDLHLSYLSMLSSVHLMIQCYVFSLYQYIKVIIRTAYKCSIWNTPMEKQNMSNVSDW